jgi:hypothetical protein
LHPAVAGQPDNFGFLDQAEILEYFLSARDEIGIDPSAAETFKGGLERFIRT